MGFWSALFGGSNPTLNQDIGNVGQIGGFATKTGEGDISQASNFWSDILSGDQAKIGKVLAPEISGIQKRGQQQKQTNSIFGNRSGGTNASNQLIDDNSRSAVNGMISDLTGKAAGELGSLGTNLLSQGEGAYKDQAQLSQERMKNWLNSILGGGVSKAFSAAESFGLDKIFPSGGSGYNGGGTSTPQWSVPAQSTAAPSPIVAPSLAPENFLAGGSPELSGILSAPTSGPILAPNVQPQTSDLSGQYLQYNPTEVVTHQIDYNANYGAGS